MKRKRKEHRSLDSILFEDDDELEYFDVLDLLPLSNVKLELENSSSKVINEKTSEEEEKNNVKLEELTHCTSSTDDEENSTNDKESLERRSSGISERCNITDEEKCQSHSDGEGKAIKENERTTWGDIKSAEGASEDDVKVERQIRETLNEEASAQLKLHETTSEVEGERINNDKSEEVEDYKSIWISDGEEIEEMSRRPQVMRIIDNEVTKRHSSYVDPVNLTYRKAKQEEHRDGNKKIANFSEDKFNGVKEKLNEIKVSPFSFT